MLRLGHAFCDVDITIDKLKVWQPPIIEQHRPRFIPVLAPHPKQGRAMINFGALPQPSAGFATAPGLQAPQKLRVITRRTPELPCDHAGAMPDRVLVSPRVPQIDVPAETINRLPAHTAKAWAKRVCVLPIGPGRCSECSWQPVLSAVAKAPAPATWRSAAGSKRTRQAISAKWMGAPIRIDCKPWCGRHNTRPRARDRTTEGKISGNALLRRTSDLRFFSAFSSCHLDMIDPAIGDIMPLRRKAFVTNATVGGQLGTIHKRGRAATGWRAWIAKHWSRPQLGLSDPAFYSCPADAAPLRWHHPCRLQYAGRVREKQPRTNAFGTPIQIFSGTLVLIFSVFLILWNREAGVLYVGLDLRRVQVDESFCGTFAYKQFGASDAIWRHRCIGGTLPKRHLITGEVGDIKAISITSTNPAHVPDVMTQ